MVSAVFSRLMRHVAKFDSQGKTLRCAKWVFGTTLHARVRRKFHRPSIKKTKLGNPCTVSAELGISHRVVFNISACPFTLDTLLQFSVIMKNMKKKNFFVSQNFSRFDMIRHVRQQIVTDVSVLSDAAERRVKGPRLPHQEKNES